MNMWVAGVLLAFLLPVLYIIFNEWRKKKKAEKEGAQAPPRKKEPIRPASLAVASVLMFILVLPALFFSDSSYSYYAEDDALFKIAFKHTGNRVDPECDETEFIKKAGERYRKELKDTRQVQMNIAQLKCRRERHPVRVEVYMDGRELLSKSYAPTGLKKDMASYIYEEFIFKPGTYRFTARLFAGAPGSAPDSALEETVEIRPKEIRLLRYDEKIRTLVLE